MIIKIQFLFFYYSFVELIYIFTCNLLITIICIGNLQFLKTSESTGFKPKTYRVIV